jgi:nitric oxide reductase NorE protein
MQQAEIESPTQAHRLPGDSGVWTFILADMCAFALFFLLFSVGRAQVPELYETSRLRLDPMLGVLNTLILLTSSLFMVLAVKAARRQERSATLRNLVLAILIGLGFAVTKVIEYAAKGEALA